MSEVKKETFGPTELKDNILVQGMLTLGQTDFDNARGLLKKGLENLIGNGEISNQVAKQFKELLKAEKGRTTMEENKWISFPTEKVLEMLEEIKQQAQALFPQEELVVGEHWVKDYDFEGSPLPGGVLESYDLYIFVRTEKESGIAKTIKYTVGFPIVSIVNRSQRLNCFEFWVEIYHPHPDLKATVKAKFGQMPDQYQPCLNFYDTWKPRSCRYDGKKTSHSVTVSALNLFFGLFGKEIRNKQD